MHRAGGPPPERGRGGGAASRAAPPGSAPKPKSEAKRRRIGKAPERYHHGNLRRALIDAALQLIAEQGPSTWSLRAAAEVAGVTPGAPYRHFRDKNELLAAVATEGFDALRAFLSAELARAGDDPLGRLWAIGAAYVRFALEHPPWYRVMFGPDLADKAEHAALHEAARAAFGIFPPLLERCQQAGVVRGDEPALVLAAAAWCTMHGVAEIALTRQLSGTGLPPDRQLSLPEIVGRILYEGLAPRGRHARFPRRQERSC